MTPVLSSASVIKIVRLHSCLKADPPVCISPNIPNSFLVHQQSHRRLQYQTLLFAIPAVMLVAFLTRVFLSCCRWPGVSPQFQRGCYIPLALPLEHYHYTLEPSRLE